MSGCEHYQELISRILDEELSRDERAALAEHLGTCRECAAMYQAFSALSDTISSDLAEPPEELTDNIMAEIRRSEIRRKNRRMPASAKGLIAAAACLALIAATAGGISAVTRHRNETAVFEDRTSRIISGNIAADDSAAASVEAPSPSPEASAAQGAEAYSAAPRLSDSENYGYVPGRGTETAKTPAVTAAPDYSKFPTFTPAPGLVPTPTPTAVPTPVPTATPDAAQFAAPEESALPVETPAPTATPSAGDIDEALIAVTPTATPAPADGDNATPGGEDGAPLVPPAVADEAAEKIVRRIDLTAIDAGGLVKVLLTPQTVEADDDAQGGDAASTEAADASDASAAADAPEATPAPTTTPVATPTPTPAATPEASNAEGASDSGDDAERPPVVSAPEAIDDALKAVLPAGIGFDKVDVIRCIHSDAEATLIVCISGDEVLVLSYDAEDNILSTLPDLDAHQYAALIDPYIAQATQAAAVTD